MKLESALSGEATFDAGILGLSDAQRLRLGPLFDGGIPNLRPLFPVDESGRLDRCRLPDPTFGGIVPDLTQAHFDELVGRPCNDE